MDIKKYNIVKCVSRIILLLLLFVFSGQQIEAQTKAQLQNQKSQLEAEINKLNKELSNAKRNTQLSQRQLNALNKKINERTKLINNINKQMSLLDQEILHTQDSLSVMHSRIDSLKHEYAKTIRILYSEHSNIDKTVLLFDTPSYNKSYLRLKYFNEYSRYRKQQANYINDRQRELESVSQQLQKQKDEKNTLLAQERKNKEQLSAEQKQKQQSLNASRNKEKTLTAKISKKEQQKRDLDKQIKKLINEEVRKAATASANTNKKTSSTGSTANKTTTAPASQETALSTDFGNNKGRFSWPVYYKKVLREYGKYTHASGGENMNNGIDLATAPGASVYCIFNGTVSRVFTCPNGNKGIIIRHGDYMTVYANLATINVKQGTKVSTKQVIGTVASSDGQGEFSFQIWKGTTSQNPRSWLRH